jgi:hypothetical protein
MEAAAPPTVPGRACGACMMCCKVPHIAEFDKPAGVWCRHAAPGKGCTIYAERPGSCRAFFCLWMQDATFGPEWKPDRAKFVTYLQGNGINLQVAVDPAFPNAWRREPYFSRIAQWARAGAPEGRFVYVRIGARLIALLPDGERDLGEVDPQDDIFIARRRDGPGFRYEIEVRRKAAG